MKHEGELSDAAEAAKAEKAEAGCGNCYGAEDETVKCCPRCEDVRDAYARKGWHFKPEFATQVLEKKRECRVEKRELRCTHTHACAYIMRMTNARACFSVLF